MVDRSVGRLVVAEIESNPELRALIIGTKLYSAANDAVVAEIIAKKLQARGHYVDVDPSTVTSWRSRQGIVNFHPRREKQAKEVPATEGTNTPDVLHLRGVVEKFGMQLEEGCFRLVDQDRYFVAKSQGCVIAGRVQVVAAYSLRIDVV